MTSPTLTAAKLVVAPVTAAAIGAVIAAHRRPSPSTTSVLQHLAAGIVIAAVAGEVLPDLRDRHSLAATLIGFTIGVTCLLALSKVETRAEQCGQTKGVPTAMLVALSIDLFIDGILVGTGAALGEGQGRILTIALTFEILFLALSLTGELVERGLSTARATLIPIAASTTTIVGALVGAAILGHATNAIQAAVLAFGSAALLYLVTEELLTEAHDTPDTTLHVAMFFVGFIALFTLEGIV
jgi:ZIP family zinc transporter